MEINLQAKGERKQVKYVKAKISFGEKVSVWGIYSFEFIFKFFRARSLTLFIWWLFAWWPFWLIGKINCLHLSKIHKISGSNTKIFCISCGKFIKKIHTEDLPIKIKIERKP